jgi:hypothetical protein
MQAVRDDQAKAVRAQPYAAYPSGQIFRTTKQQEQRCRTMLRKYGVTALLAITNR